MSLYRKLIILILLLIVMGCTNNVNDNQEQSCSVVEVIVIDSIFLDDPVHRRDSTSPEISVKLHSISLSNLKFELSTESQTTIDLALDNRLYFEFDTIINKIDKTYNLEDTKQLLGKQEFKELAQNFAPNQLNIVFADNALIDAIYQLQAFTPIFVEGFEAYEIVQPLMDCIFISTSRLEDEDEFVMTFVHEIGHYLGLTHPFEMTEEQLRLINLTSHSDMCRNYMNYNCFVDQFTTVQLDIMENFLYMYRSYIINQ